MENDISGVSEHAVGKIVRAWLTTLRDIPISNLRVEDLGYRKNARGRRADVIYAGSELERPFVLFKLFVPDDRTVRIKRDFRTRFRQFLAGEGIELSEETVGFKESKHAEAVARFRSIFSAEQTLPWFLGIEVIATVVRFAEIDALAWIAVRKRYEETTSRVKVLIKIKTSKAAKAEYNKRHPLETNHVYVLVIRPQMADREVKSVFFEYLHRKYGVPRV